MQYETTSIKFPLQAPGKLQQPNASSDTEQSSRRTKASITLHLVGSPPGEGNLKGEMSPLSDKQEIPLFSH